MAGTTPFVTQPELTAIAIAYMQQPSDFIADLVLPRVKAVGKREFKYQVYGRNLRPAGYPALAARAAPMR